MAEAPLRDVPALLDRHCATPEVRRQVEAALAELHEDETLGGFLDQPALGVSSDASTDTVAGRRIGRYELVRILGEGGMGTVYEAHQENPRRAVALKVLKGGAFSPSALRRFERESAVLGLLHHSGIAQIFEAGVEVTPLGRVPFFAMELVKGEPLDTWARLRSPETQTVLEVAARICDAVHHAHTHGIVHRDLKPGNIMVVTEEAGTGSRHGEHAAGSGVFAPGLTPKILDFGVARIVSPEVGVSNSTQTEAGQIVGTLTYMSPEQVSSRFGSVGPRTDVYALGVILYELLAGKPPFDVRTRTLPEATHIIVNETPPRLRRVSRRLHEDVETIVAKAMDKEPKRRYASAAELAMDLRRFLHKEPIAARPATTIYQLRRFAARNRTLVGGIVATFIALAAGLVGTVVFARKAAEQGELAARRAEEAERKSYLSDIRAAQAAILSSESSIARASLDAATPALRGWEWEHLNWTLGRGGEVIADPIQGGNAYATGYGSFMYVGRDDIVRVNADTGERELLITRPGRPPIRALWCTTDGRFIRASLGAPNIEIWDTSTRRLVREYTTPESAPRLLGDRVVVSAREPGAQAVITDAFTGTLLGRQPNRELTADLITPDGRPGRFIWDAANMRYMPVPADTPPWPVTGVNHYVSPLGRYLTRYAGRFRSWDVLRIADGSRQGTIEATGDIASHGFSPIRHEVAISTNRNTVEIWDLNAVARRVTLSTRGIARGIRMTPDGRWLLATEHDGRILRWDANTSPSPFTFVVGQPLAISPDTRLVIGRAWGAVRCWDTESGGLRWTRFIGHTYANAAAFSPDGSRLALALSGRVLILDAATGNEIARADGIEPSLLLAVAFGPGGDSLYLGAADGRLVRMNAAEGWASARTLPQRHGSPISAIRFSPDGAFFATGSGEGRILQDVMIPQGGDDASIRLWDARTDTPLAVSTARRGRITDLCFAHDVRTLYSTDMDGSLAAWRLPDLTPVWERSVSENGVTSVSLMPDGRGFVIGESQGAIHLLGGVSNADVVLPRSAAGVCFFARFTPDGRTLIAGALDELMRFETGPPSCGLAERELRRRARAVFNRLTTDALVEERLEQARRLCDQWGEDRAAVEAMVITDGEMPTLMVNTAFLAALDGKADDPAVERAVRQARRATEILPTYSYYWDTLALALHRRGRADEALAASDQAGAADSAANPSATHQFVRALILAARGDREAAGLCLERGKALMSSPGNATFESNSVLRAEAQRILAAP